MLREKIPGMAVAVVAQDRVICSRGYGTTSVEAGGCEVTPDTLFRVGSITKLMTATAVLSLVEAGKLDLDAPVTHYVPWLELSEPGGAEGITLRMLLAHSSGLPTDIAEVGARDPEGLVRFLRTDLRHYPLAASPGRLFQYSNLGYSLLGHVAETATGQSYAQLMNDLVFIPLQMDRTTLDPTLAMTYPLSQSHRLGADGSLHVVRPFADNTAFAPAGFAFSTVLDLAKFAQWQLSAAHSVEVPTYGAGGGGRGLGPFLSPHPGSGLPRVGHFGGISGFRALLEIYPMSKAAVIVLMNRAASVGLIRDILLEECLGLPVSGWAPAYVEPDSAAWPAYAGTYVSDSRGMAEVSSSGEDLTLTWNGDEFLLRCIAPDHYASSWRPGLHLGVGFVRDDRGQVDFLMVDEAPFRRIRPPDPSACLGHWQKYAGSYRLKQPPMTVRVQDGALLLHSAFYGQEVRCVPLGGHAFACKWGRFSFVVGDDDEVQGMRWPNGLFVPRI